MGELVHYFDHPHGQAEKYPIMGAEKLVKRRQTRSEHVKLDQNQNPCADHHGETKEDARAMKQPRRVPVQPVQNSLRIKPAKTNGKDVGELAEQLFAFLLVTPFLQLPPLPRGFRNHQSATVQHTDELLQVLVSDLLWCELGLELLLDFLQACLAVEHLQDRELLLVETEVVQPDGLFDDPVYFAVVTLLARRQIRAHSKPQSP